MILCWRASTLGYIFRMRNEDSFLPHLILNSVRLYSELLSLQAQCFKTGLQCKRGMYPEAVRLIQIKFEKHKENLSYTKVSKPEL
jgi:hypothetical protein